MGQWQATQDNLSLSVSQIQPDLFASLIEFPKHELEANDKFPADLSCPELENAPLEQCLLEAQLKVRQ